MTNKQVSILLISLLTFFVIRCSLSIGFSRGADGGFTNYRSSVIDLEIPLLGTPAPSPEAVPRQDGISSLPVDIDIVVPAPSVVLRQVDEAEDLNSPTYSNTSIISEYPTLLHGINKNPKVEPIWRYLASYLSRPGVPKVATKAMKEGLRAWRRINKTMTDETQERVTYGSGRRSGNKCPYLVSALNASELKSTPYILPIPCGLILDSSVTIVGTPGIKTGTFSLELIGSKLFGEGDEPVVFHFSVRLHGDEITNKPTIVQNTWTVSRDWQDEQRCPPQLDDTDTDSTVDGLRVCNTDVGQNITRESGPGLWKGLNQRLTNVWFPFVEGFPFVATISAGWDGYHVSVNGKHVTAFKYRQSLEPWMVNSFRIKGDLNISSVIANGLPISGDASFVPDLEVIRAPKLPKNTTLFIGVFSSNSNFFPRMGIRRTWMQYPEVRNGTVVVRFFVGLHQNEQVNRELWTESLTYGDVQLLPMVDYYDIITYKTLAICMFAKYNLNAKYVMKTDDDSFLRVDAVLSSIFVTEPNSTLLIPKYNHSLLLGNIAFNDPPDRDPNSKWFTSTIDWANETYPPWAHGPGYILSQDIAHFVVKGHQKNFLKFFKLEDVAMGIWIDRFAHLRHKKVKYVHEKDYLHGKCETDYIITHYQNPSQMQCLWNNELEGAHGTCCNDITI